MSHTYALRYSWNMETREQGYQQEDANDYGLCDAMLGISIIYFEDGSYSQAVFSCDGKEGRPLTQDEIFKAWLTLGLSLHDQGELEGWKKVFVSLHSEFLRDIFKHKKDCATHENRC